LAPPFSKVDKIYTYYLWERWSQNIQLLPLGKVEPKYSFIIYINFNLTFLAPPFSKVDLKVDKISYNINGYII